jgi:hypothetical protein
MHCGQALAVSAPAPTGPSAPSASPAKKAAWLGILAGIVIVGAAIFGLSAAGILRLPGQRVAANTLQAQGEQPNVPILPARGSTGPPTLQDPALKPVMPADVRLWLEHLERIERKRVEMSEEQLASAISMMATLQLGGSMSEIDALLSGEGGFDDPTAKPPTIAQAESDLAEMRQKWAALTAEFNSVQTPPECVPIRNEYDEVVRETGAMLMDILHAIGGAGTDRDGALKTLLGMRGKSDKRIGEPAVKSDDLVQAICDKYQTRKWFEIARDVGGGGMMKGFGF